jgi:hypothetical protein
MPNLGQLERAAERLFRRPFFHSTPRKEVFHAHGSGRHGARRRSIRDRSRPTRSPQRSGRASRPVVVRSQVGDLDGVAGESVGVHLKRHHGGFDGDDVPHPSVRERLETAKQVLRSVHDKVQKMSPSPRTQHIRTARNRAGVYYPAVRPSGARRPE